MKKELEEYIKYVENNKKKKDLKEEVLIKIKFFEHERLVHLIVTFFTGIAAILFFLGFLIIESIPLFILFIITLLLFIPYIIHYFYLENGTQKLQRLYFKI